MEKRIKSFRDAFRGIYCAIKSERNMQIHIVVALAVVVGGIVFQISSTEWIMCVVCFGMVISAELFNTAIESIVDLVSPEQHPLAGRAKDVAAGAVLFAAICSAIIGFIVFLPKVLPLVGIG